MLAEQRYKEISEILEREGSVKTVTLCGILGTSRETVRRDLETMEERNMLKRIHGGAMRMEPAEEAAAQYTSFNKRKEEHPVYKEIIAREAARFIREGQSVALDSGTTSLALAKVIRRKFRNLTVVTNSFAVADELRGAKGISLVLTGGLYKADEDAFVSDIATLIFSRINIDVFFLTTCGISVERGITYQRMDEIQVQNSMMEAAAETIVIADSSKLGVNSLVRMCGVEEISRLITDSGITKRQADDFKAAGVRVTVAEERKEEES
ncbi:DeoR/GlpR transcriptional regulator [Mediterraneibacter glycyrrhizinilyticus]|nr:DeoR/GlpR family DNA-binding transcription regulator [Mediterraneibacter glycyrrhizinilyticus]MBM6854819.1 DeoR/GlpR transcriptional regulator [Mediterraneibacter glycyrrhizinilyticus]